MQVNGTLVARADYEALLASVAAASGVTGSGAGSAPGVVSGRGVADGALTSAVVRTAAYTSEQYPLSSLIDVKVLMELRNLYVSTVPG